MYSTFPGVESSYNDVVLGEMSKYILYFKCEKKEQKRLMFSNIVSTLF